MHRKTKSVDVKPKIYFTKSKIMPEQKPSKTARKVALNILTFAAKPDMEKVLPTGIADATEQLLIASGVASSRTIRFSRSRQMFYFYKAFDWMMPGQFEAFALRKAFCERQVRESIDAGMSQILFLGAGFDTMGWRLAPEYPNVDFFEIDHPATATFKLNGIQKMGMRENLHFIAKDLRKHRLTDILVNNNDWNLIAQTTIVAEGLLQYLAADSVKDLFTQCTSIAGDSKMVFSYIPTRQDGLPDAGPLTSIVLWLLKISGEPWLWSIRPEDLGSFLEKTGWENVSKMAGQSGKYGVEIFAVAKKNYQRGGSN